MDINTEAVAATAEQYPSSNTVAAQHARDTLLLSPLSGGDDHALRPPEAGGHTFPPQIRDNLMTGTHEMGGSPSAMGMPGALAVEAAEDVVDALGLDLPFDFDGDLGDGSIDIHDNVENTFVENNLDEEDVVDRPAIESDEGACRCVRPLGPSSL